MRKPEKREKEERKEIPKRIYTDHELRIFEREIEQLRVTKKLDYPVATEVSFIPWEEVLIQQKVAVRKDGYFLVKVDEWGEPYYREVDNKLEQLAFLQGKATFAEKKRLEGLDELAKQYAVPEPITADSSDEFIA